MNVRKALMLCGVSLLAVALTAPASLAAYSGVTIAGNGSLQWGAYTPSPISGDTTNIAAGAWPDLMVDDPVGGGSTADSDSGTMQWSFDFVTDPLTTVTANFTITPDLFTENVGDWASLEYWVKLEMKTSVGSVLVDVDEVHPAAILIEDGTLTEPIDVSVSVTAHKIAGYSNNVKLTLTAYAAVEAFTAEVEEPEPEEPPATIPAPGAVVLSSLGAGLVGWLRKRKTL